MGIVFTPDLEKMAEAIVECVQPETIILFGSRARETHTPEADVDLLVVEREPFGPERSRHAELIRIREALSDFHVPIDVVLFSKSEFEKWQDSINHLVARALREGKILYERTCSRVGTAQVEPSRFSGDREHVESGGVQ